MKKARRIISSTLSLCLVFVMLFSVQVSSLDPIGTVRVQAGVNIRSSPGAYNDVDNFLAQTSAVTDFPYFGISYDRDGDPWYHILYGNTYAYVYVSYAQVVETYPPPEEPGDPVTPVTPEIPAKEIVRYVMANDTVNMRSGPGTNYDYVGELWPCRVGCYGTVTGADGYTWYNIQSPGGLDVYVRGDFIDEYNYNYDAQFEQTLLQFPQSYRDALRHLHTRHPNWKFYADDLSVSFEYAVGREVGRKIISNGWTSLPQSWRTYVPGGATLEPNSMHASETAIRFVMAPENFISEVSVFMFMSQTYDPEAQTAAGVKSLVSGTYLDRDDYISYIMEAAELSGVSPYVLASTIIHEQGVQGSVLSLGTYPGYEGYYNFFNFAASGSTVEQIIVNGLEYAKKCGWNSPRASIIGGAEEYGENYVSTGQYTYYYKDYNVICQTWGHQYATGIFDHINNAASLSQAYIGDNSALSFRIPVFSDADFGGHIHSHTVWNCDVSRHWISCADCGGSVNYNPHSFASVEVIKSPGLFENGITKSICCECGFVKISETPPLISFTSSGNGVIITGINGTLPQSVVIPESIGGKPVTGIAEYAFFNAASLKELTVRASGVIIGTKAIPQSVTVICNEKSRAAEYAKQNGNPILIYGDTDNDGTVTENDATFLAKYIAGLEKSVSFDMRTADVNNDGTIDVCDCVYILSYVNGNINEF